MSQKIIFTDTTGIMPVEVHPYPCAKDLPDWYKKTESYVNGLKKPDGLGGTTASIKKCVPVFDAITAGYLIPLPADVYVSLQEIEGEKKQWFEWASFELITPEICCKCFKREEEETINFMRSSFNKYEDETNAIC